MKASAYIFSYLRFSLFLMALALFGSAGLAHAQEFDHGHELYDEIVRAHVKDGAVDYKALKADPKMLDQYLAGLAAVSEERFESWDESQRLAFLFNLYNAATLKLILDHYPIKSIKDIGGDSDGPWDRPIVKLFDKAITLNALEHEILRKQYKEPRLHLALVCAAKGCPSLRSEAYIAKRLKEQLEDQAKLFMEKSSNFRIDRDKKTVYFSAIFNWYGKDFQANYSPTKGFTGLNETERAVANFCARFIPEEDRKYLEAGGYSVEYLDYDWSLNEAAEHTTGRPGSDL